MDRSYRNPARAVSASPIAAATARDLHRFRASPAADPAQQGFTLIETLAAWTIALVVLLAALGAVSSLRGAYARAESALDAAERVRLGAETIARTIALAGLGVDPDGAPGRPDEAIEGAWRGAVAVRGDLDAGDPDARDDPERWIGGSFPSTATGNDEIVAFALRKESGSGGADVAFEADVSSPVIVTTPSGDHVALRDGAVEAVRLARVVAAGGGSAGPGCSLYRATVASNADLWGTGNAITWQPVVDGVSTLSFRYFDAGGEELAPPGGDEGTSVARAAIASVEVRLVALEKRPDAAWTDPSDPDPATVHYRKARLVTRVDLPNARRAARPA